MRPLAPKICALLLASGCAGAPPARSETDALREELHALRRDNEALAARVQALSSQVDLLTVRASRSADAGRAPPDAEAAPGRAVSAVPPDLAVVRVAPPPGRSTARAPARAPRGPPPPISTAVPIQDPDLSRLEATLGRPGRRALSAEAEQDLKDAQAQSGLARAHALEDFTAHYPQHPHADNALIEAAEAYQAAGRDDAACALSRRVVDEYPAGDARSDALERLATCAARRGALDEAQKLVARLRADFPGTPAALRAEARLSQAPGRDAESVPARSGP